MKNWKRRFDEKLGINVLDAEKCDYCSVIRSLRVERDETASNRNGAIKHIRIVVGHHHYLNVDVEQDFFGQERVLLEVGSTHHGAKFCASLVGGDLDKAIDFLRENFPENIMD